MIDSISALACAGHVRELLGVFGHRRYGGGLLHVYEEAGGSSGSRTLRAPKKAGKRGERMAIVGSNSLIKTDALVLWYFWVGFVVACSVCLLEEPCRHGLAVLMY